MGCATLGRARVHSGRSRPYQHAFPEKGGVSGHEHRTQTLAPSDQAANSDFREHHGPCSAEPQAHSDVRGGRSQPRPRPRRSCRAMISFPSAGIFQAVHLCVSRHSSCLSGATRLQGNAWSRGERADCPGMLRLQVLKCSCARATRVHLAAWEATSQARFARAAPVRARHGTSTCMHLSRGTRTAHAPAAARPEPQSVGDGRAHLLYRVCQRPTSQRTVRSTCSHPCSQSPAARDPDIVLACPRQRGGTFMNPTRWQGADSQAGRACECSGARAASSWNVLIAVRRGSWIALRQSSGAPDAHDLVGASWQNGSPLGQRRSAACLVQRRSVPRAERHAPRALRYPALFTRSFCCGWACTRCVVTLSFARSKAGRARGRTSVRRLAVGRGAYASLYTKRSGRQTAMRLCPRRLSLARRD